MISEYQHTLKSPISFSGVGLHSGHPTTITLTPAIPYTGIAFVFNDDEQTHVAANLKNVVSTSYSTSLIKNGCIIQTVEHLLATLYAHHIDNCLIYVDENEIPILDGSAIEFSQAVLSAGYVEQDELVTFFKLPRGRIEVNNSLIITSPNDTEFNVSVDVRFKNISQHKTFRVDSITFHNDLAAAPTFVYSDDINKLKQAGLIKGGSLDNAIVLDSNGDAINPHKLVFGDDIVRHKILDTIGDFSLCGNRILGDIYIFKPGHTVNVQFIKQLMSTCSPE